MCHYLENCRRYVQKLLFMTNRKLHMRFRLTPRSMTLDDLELYMFEISVNFSGFRRFGTQQQLNEWRETSIVSDNVVSTSNWSNFLHAFASRGFVSDSWAFLFHSTHLWSSQFHNRREAVKPTLCDTSSGNRLTKATKQSWGYTHPVSNRPFFTELTGTVLKADGKRLQA